MDTRGLAVGDRIEHGQHAGSTVIFVGADYIGIEFDDGCEMLLRRTALESDAPIPAELEEAAAREDVPWPDSTFVADGKDAKHFLGSHWEPIVEDAAEIMKRLPEYLPKALLQGGYGAHRKSPRSLPDDWPKGFQLVWPAEDQGLAIILRAEKEANLFVSLFPFFSTGCPQTLVLQSVHVWSSGAEAQIAASWDEGEVTFFDSRYLVNRAWYETGNTYDFVLSAIAYVASHAQHREIKVSRHPEEVAWMNRNLKEGKEPYEADCTVSFDGAAMLLPISEWDVDDYSFRAPVKSVTEFSDWLGQDGWIVRATVMRFGDNDADLDIVITRRAWSGDGPPRVGDDIEGRFWLQGYLETPG